MANKALIIFLAFFLLSQAKAETYQNLNEGIIQSYSSSITEIESELANYPNWMQAEIYSKTNLSLGKIEFGKLRNEYLAASNEEEQKHVYEKLSKLHLPLSVSIARSTEPITIGFDNLDMATIRNISHANIDDKNVLLLWVSQNFRSEITINKIQITYFNSSETISDVKIDTSPIRLISNTIYLIFNKDDSEYVFQNDPTYLNRAAYFTLDDSNAEVRFIIYGDKNAQELGAYIAPTVQELEAFSATYYFCNYNSRCENELGELYQQCGDCRHSRSALTAFIVIMGLFAMATLIWIYTRYQLRKKRRKVY